MVDDLDLGWDEDRGETRRDEARCWARLVFTPTMGNVTRVNMGTGGDRIRGVEYVDGFLTVINVVERFPYTSVAFPIDMILE